ncbi:TCR/Tet family MFS transporter [Novispirillum itersonii]|uniref:DHA1 family tetracycline resistance protein-like MFS transporter n=1 Tax=Novispirillum itersonii TaxID=189 RepID=A0A7X0DLI5_NOVIT|nr:TCR/Tet family MFS transporter [Novispirillum itersonii]MBB6210016.1 DHA1 family tetracycline resistance protein-like MFS transporter [Novispirillum itersonii]
MPHRPPRVAASPLIIAYAIIFLDAVGIGLIFPILPQLLAEVTHGQDAASGIGLMAALYAAMQFLLSPALGALSDTFGRRPVLLLSLTGAAINYAIMAVAPSFWMLLAGRAIAGLTSANMSVASAYITDITPPMERASRFGLFNAMFGAGFIVGPVLGGILGDFWIRLPFIAAAALTAGTLLLALFSLPETRQPSPLQIGFMHINPLRPFLDIRILRGVTPILLVSFIMAGAGEAYGVCWTLWGTDTFQWSGLEAGLSLGAFGVCQAVAQASLPGRLSRWLGERRAAITGIICGGCALTLLAFTRQSWVVYASMPVFVLSGIGMPALLALVTRSVDADRQGQFQGLLTSMASLASILSPLGFSHFYSTIRTDWPGAVWLLVAGLNLLVIPLILVATRRGSQVAPKAAA